MALRGRHVVDCGKTVVQQGGKANLDVCVSTPSRGIRCVGGVLEVRRDLGTRYGSQTGTYGCSRIAVGVVDDQLLHGRAGPQ